MSLDVYLEGPGTPRWQVSLDVYLEGPGTSESCFCPNCDNEHRATRREELFNANITHNLWQMASVAGIYEALWRPEEIQITTAAQLIPLLEEGLRQLQAEPAKFFAFSAANGWGTYEQFIPWVERYLEACKQYPHATVRASR